MSTVQALFRYDDGLHLVSQQFLSAKTITLEPNLRIYTSAIYNVISVSPAAIVRKVVALQPFPLQQHGFTTNKLFVIQSTAVLPILLCILQHTERHGFYCSQHILSLLYWLKHLK